MDFARKQQLSREGFRDALATHKRMLADLDDGTHAAFEQQAAAIRETFKANSVPVNADTARAFHMALMLPSVDILATHGSFRIGDCLEDHLLSLQLVGALFRITQEEAS